jgi:hypothetical protein
MSNRLDSGIMTAMTKIGNLVAEEARRRVKTARMAGAISLSEAKKLSNGNYYIDMIINLDENTGAPEFMAYEKGSGLYGEQNETYVIAPKKAEALAFPFTLTSFSGKKLLGGYVDGQYKKAKYINKEVMISDHGQVFVDPAFWSYVDHPGVEARPAVKPAFKAKRQEAMEIFKQSVGKSIGLILKEATKPNA